MITSEFVEDFFITNLIHFRAHGTVCVQSSCFQTVAELFHCWLCFLGGHVWLADRLTVLYHADRHQAGSRAGALPEPGPILPHSPGACTRNRAQGRRSEAGPGGREARVRALRAGEPGQGLSLPGGWEHQAHVLRLWAQRDGEEGRDRHEVWKVGRKRPRIQKLTL